VPRWLTRARALVRIHALSASGAFRLTHKAESEALLLGCSAADVRDIVGSLTASDFCERLTSTLSGEWIDDVRQDRSEGSMRRGVLP